jgi:hypothetical protein
MGLPHACLECSTIKGAGRTAFNTNGDFGLERRDNIMALLIFPDQMTDIVARVTEATILGSALNPVFHRVGQGYIHRRHCLILLRFYHDNPEWQRLSIFAGKHCHCWGQKRPKTKTVLAEVFGLINALILGGAGRVDKNEGF